MFILLIIILILLLYLVLLTVPIIYLLYKYKIGGKVYDKKLFKDFYDIDNIFDIF